MKEEGNIKEGPTPKKEGLSNLNRPRAFVPH
jgi:hypothetical protein